MFLLYDSVMFLLHEQRYFKVSVLLL